MNITCRWSLASLFGLVLYIWSPGWAPAAQSKLPDSPALLWSAEVVEGLSGDRNVASLGLGERNRPGVEFLSNSQLIVYAVDVDTSQLSSRKSPDVSSPFRLRLSILEADSGKIALTKEWGTRFRDSSVHVTIGGILIRTGEILRLYSKDFVELHEVPLPQPDPHDKWVVSVSPSGKTAMLNHYDLKESHFEVLDGSTLKLKKAWSEGPLRHPYSISDTGIATANPQQDHIAFSEFGTGQWDAVGAQVGFVALPTLVTDRLLVSGGAKEFALITIEGKVLMTDRSGKHETVAGEKIAVAQGGTVIAASLVEGKGGGFFDTDVRTTRTSVVVYDVSLKKRLLTLEVSPLPKRNYDFALSPDGSKLAILNDRKVSVYSMPVQ